MEPENIILFNSVVLVGGLLIFNAIRLSRRDDWFDRITQSHATLYSRLAEYGFWTLRHVIAGIRDPRDRGRRFVRALFCVGMFILVAMPVFLAAQMANLGGVAEHPVAFALGTAAWSMIVEAPSLPYRVQIHAPQSTLVPPVAGALIVAVLDLVVGGLALAGIAPGAGEAFAIGAAFVAMGDLVSGMIGLTTAGASTYPFKDPPPPLPEAPSPTSAIPVPTQRAGRFLSCKSVRRRIASRRTGAHANRG